LNDFFYLLLPLEERNIALKTVMRSLKRLSDAVDFKYDRFSDLFRFIRFIYQSNK
jgi:hypothetical protein